MMIATNSQRPCPERLHSLAEDEMARAVKDRCQTSACCAPGAPPPVKPQKPSASADCHADWYVLNCEQNSSIPQTLEVELQRQKALQSFQIIDAVAKAATVPPTSGPCAHVDMASTMSTMDHIVTMAKSIFQTEMAVLSLSDLGRQYVLAQSGLPEGVTQIPRRDAICAHAVLCTEDAFVIPDTSVDPRFGEHVIPENVLFYAGVPLITPEGDRIGAMCVLDTETRPQGITPEQKHMLIHFAGIAMNALVERRSRIQQERKLKKASRVISSTVHDLMTPLTAVELALSLLYEDQDFVSKLLVHQKESIKIASNCIGVLGRMCRTMRDQHSDSCKRQVDGKHNSKGTDDNDTYNPDFGLTADSFRIMYLSGEEDESDSAYETKALVAGHRVTVDVKELVKNIHMAMDAIPKTIPIAIVLHPTVPTKLVTDDLKVLRCALNLIQHCASVAKTGSIQLSIKAQQCRCGKSMLGFICENRLKGGSYITADESIMSCCNTSCAKSFEPSSSSASSQDCCHNNRNGQDLRSYSEINLYSVAMQMEAIGGDCGILQNGSERDISDSFWFRVPLEEPAESLNAEYEPKPKGHLSPLFDTDSGSHRHLSANNANAKQVPSKSADSFVLEAQPRRRRALIIEDSIVIRKVIANALSKIGFEAVTAVNGMEGLQMLQSSLYDVVLCDFLMPVMDGLDCVHQYREWEKTHRQWLRQYIIGMSAHASDQDVERGLRIGMDCYKPKPLTYQGLKDLVEACEKNQENWISNSFEKLEKNPLSSNIDNYSVRQKTQPKMCLIASKDDAYDLARLTEAKGWNSLIVHDGEGALQALKKRNWDAVVLDENLPLLSGTDCAVEFREWERENRVNLQSNFLVMKSQPKTSQNQSGTIATSPIPVGFDGLLHKPIQPKEFEKTLQEAEEPTLNIIMR